MRYRVGFVLGLRVLVAVSVTDRLPAVLTRVIMPVAVARTIPKIWHLGAHIIFAWNVVYVLGAVSKV